eukprot:TRINITY_DN19466_c0_g1_i1.p1 TRINITY_DN19466_c0_g1~~TRINITY_DN19466_c0_g1_i1.p1  ORF type:complete len:293 (+),score=81.24 TRINITY_DN19466_c0_g1_i1:84-962(+)
MISCFRSSVCSYLRVLSKHSVQKRSLAFGLRRNMAMKFVDVGEKSDVPVILIHAFPLNKTFWNGQISGLSSKARLIAPDTPGFGDSPALDVQEATMADYAAAYVRLLDELQIKKAVFAGCSMGGYVLLQLWRQAPERVGGLIFCDTRADADGPDARAGRYKTIEQVQKEGTKQMSETMVTKVFSDRMRPLRPEQVQQVKDWVLAAPVVGVVQASQAMATRPDSTDLLPTITVPTLVICGSEDPITGEAVMQSLKSVPGSKFELIADAGHLAPFDSTEAVNAAIGAFLDTVKL